MAKLRLLSLTNVVLEYRVPVYNLLSETFDVTIAHHGKLVQGENIKFKQIILHPKKISVFTYFQENIYKIANEFDIVIALGDFHYLPYSLLPFHRKKKYSLSYWSIGVSASYDKHFDEDKRLDKIRFWLNNKADSLIFYTNYPIKRYVEDGGLKKEKLFVANNTVFVDERINIPPIKKHFLFVGSLYKAKKIYLLLESYLKVYKKNNNLQPLFIVGDGEEKNNILKWMRDNNLSNNIILTGPIFDQRKLKEYYIDAIACISPGQAGLTVLNSMAYGVPFVTNKNAITGGEIFNIKNNINGILYDNDEDLIDIIQDLSKDFNKVNQLSKNAQEFYFKNCTLSIMVQGIIDAANYAYNKINNETTSN